jgi:hypothetical protein
VAMHRIIEHLAPHALQAVSALHKDALQRGRPCTWQAVNAVAYIVHCSKQGAVVMVREGHSTLPLERSEVL